MFVNLTLFENVYINIFIAVVLFFIYLKIFTYTIKQYYYNKENLFSTIILCILFLPIFIILAMLYLMVTVLLFVSIGITFPIFKIIKKPNYFNNVRKRLNIFLLLSKHNYCSSIALANVLYTIDNSHQYIYDDEFLMLVRFVEYLEAHYVPRTTILHYLKEFVSASHRNVSIAEWINTQIQTNPYFIRRRAGK